MQVAGGDPIERGRSWEQPGQVRRKQPDAEVTEQGWDVLEVDLEWCEVAKCEQSRAGWSRVDEMQ